jgi:hypothetical protein
VPDRELGLVTTTFAAPTEPVPVLQVNEVEEAKTTDVHVLPPIVTVAPETKLLPVMVTDVPPAPLPEFGATPVTVGGAA